MFMCLHAQTNIPAHIIHPIYVLVLLVAAMAHEKQVPELSLKMDCPAEQQPDGEVAVTVGIPGHVVPDRQVKMFAVEIHDITL